MARGAKRAAKRRENPCRIYWGTHGCKKSRGHSGNHVCHCRSVLARVMAEYPDAFVYGEDWDNGH